VLIATLLVLLGLALLVVGGEALLRGAVGLATLMRLTPAVIGLTVVAAGTSVPELAVSVIASLRGSPDISVGNVVGSNIFNLTVVLGAVALVRPILIRGNTATLEFPVLVLVTVIAIAVTRDGRVDQFDAITFVAIYIAFTAYLVRLVRAQMSVAERKEYDQEVKALGRTGRRTLTSMLFVLGGSALLAGGAQSTVAGASELARHLGWSERLIGLTIVAVGTSLPEVVTSLVSSVRGRDDVAIGNAIGSNLFNILGILGLSALTRPLPVAPAILHTDVWWMLAITLLMFPMIYVGRRIARGKGIVLLTVYVVYTVLLIARPA